MLVPSGRRCGCRRCKILDKFFGVMLASLFMGGALFLIGGAHAAHFRESTALTLGAVFIGLAVIMAISGTVYASVFKQLPDCTFQNFRQRY